MISVKSVMKVAALVATFSFIIGYNISAGGREMSSETNALIGKWTKQTTDDCARFYPTNLEFHDGGVYAAPGAVEEGAQWHGGDWDVDGNGLFKLQMANDAMSPLNLMELSPTRFVLSDAADCTVTYVRQD